MINIDSLSVKLKTSCSLKTQSIFSHWHAFPILTSTHTYLHKNLIIPHSGSLVFTLQQYAGYGRRNTPWISSWGNIALSCALPIQWKTPPTTLGLALGAYLTHHFAQKQPLANFSLKWPNDLFLNNQKWGGLLIENVHSHTLFGIGLNIINAPPGRSFLKQVNGDSYLTILAALLDAVCETVEHYHESGNDYFVEWWQHYDALKGKSLIFNKDNEYQESICLGITPSGTLKIQTSQGILFLNTSEGVHLGLLQT